MKGHLWAVRYYEPCFDEMTTEECSSREEARQLAEVYRKDGWHDPVKIVHRISRQK